MTIDIPLTRNELLVAGGGVALGVAEVVSPPVALIVALSPLLRRGLRRLAADSNGAQPARRAPAAAPRARRAPRAGARRRRTTS